MNGAMAALNTDHRLRAMPIVLAAHEPGTAAQRRLACQPPSIAHNFIFSPPTSTAQPSHRLAPLSRFKFQLPVAFRENFGLRPFEQEAQHDGG